MKVKVDVTPSDIKLGKQAKWESCAIARALKRDGFKNVNVGKDEITVTKMGVVWEYSGSAHNLFIEKFDENKNSVTPRKFDFKFEPVEVVKEETT
jgi:hypothetical protein